MTPRAAAILKFVHGYWAAEGHGPTVREIAAAFDFESPNGAKYHIDRLVAAGHLERDGTRGIWPAGMRAKVRALFTETGA